MPSAALLALRNALREVVDLRRAGPPTPATQVDLFQMARVVGRAQVVLLSSHFERYFYAVNEEAANFLNAQRVSPAVVPLEIKLIHSKVGLEDVLTASWERREQKLQDFVSVDGWLWGGNATGDIAAARLLSWMKAPKPESLMRYYKYWGIADVFSALTRTQQTRNRLWLGVQELVDKRNNIAHGDYSAQATQVDIRRYMDSVKLFCERADRKLAIQVAKLVAGNRPW